jgi:hypothetical protein
MRRIPIPGRIDVTAIRASLFVLSALMVGEGAVGRVPSALAQQPRPEAALTAVERDTVPADAYLDAPVRALMERARAARGRTDTTLQSFEVTWRERAYLGLDAERLRRERLLFRQERAARVHWRQGDERVVKWLGIRQQSAFGRAEEDPEITFAFLDPSSDRLFLGDVWAVHPLADTAAIHYRYRSGDTLQIHLPALDRAVTMVEVVVEPREARFNLVAASLWLDLETALLIRAVYRPARDFDLEKDQPEEAGDVPRFLKPIRFATDWAVIEYGLQEFRWWLPSRMAPRRWIPGRICRSVGSAPCCEATAPRTVGAPGVGGCANGTGRRKRRGRMGSSRPRRWTTRMPTGMPSRMSRMTRTPARRSSSSLRGRSWRTRPSFPSP